MDIIKKENLLISPEKLEILNKFLSVLDSVEITDKFVNIKFNKTLAIGSEEDVLFYSDKSMVMKADKIHLNPLWTFKKENIHHQIEDFKKRVILNLKPAKGSKILLKPLRDFVC